jgi:hypothetical protein
VQRQEAKLESGHITLKMDRGLKYNNGLVAAGKFRYIVHISNKGWRQSGQKQFY